MHPKIHRHKVFLFTDISVIVKGVSQKIGPGQVGSGGVHSSDSVKSVFWQRTGLCPSFRSTVFVLVYFYLWTSHGILFEVFLNNQNPPISDFKTLIGLSDNKDV